MTRQASPVANSGDSAKDVAPPSWADEPPPGGWTVDIADGDAVTRELAWLSGFPYISIDQDRYLARAVGLERPLENERHLSDLVQFEHLQHAPDESLGACARRCEAISIDSWRLSRAMQDFGMSPDFTAAESRRMLAGIADSAWRDQAARAYAPQHVMGPNGKLLYTDPGDPERYAAEKDAAFDDLWASLRSSFGTIQARNETAKAIDVARLHAQDRMAGQWRQTLLPRLCDKSGPVSNLPLLDTGSPEQFAGIPKDRAAKCRFGSVAFSAVAGRPLTHVTVRVTVSDDAGNSADWFEYFPTLDSREVVVAPPTGRFGLCDPNGVGLPNASETLHATVSIYADEGREVDRKLDLTPPPARGPAPTEDQRRSIRATFQKVLNQFPQRKTAQLLKTLREAYPQPPNPISARARLVEKFGQGQTLAAIDQQSGKATVVLHFEPFDTKSAVLYGTLQSSGGSAIAEAHFVDEIDRGCVIAISFYHVLSSGEDADTLRRKMSEAATPSYAWVLLTAPSEIRSSVHPPTFGATPNSWFLTLAELHEDASHPQPKATPEHPKKLLKAAEYVLHVDRNGGMWLQSVTGVSDIQVRRLVPTKSAP